MPLPIDRHLQSVLKLKLVQIRSISPGSLDKVRKSAGN